MCICLLYCKIVPCTFTVSHTQKRVAIIILKIHFKLKIELIMKTHTYIVMKY